MELFWQFMASTFASIMFNSLSLALLSCSLSRELVTELHEDDTHNRVGNHSVAPRPPHITKGIRLLALCMERPMEGDS